MSKKVQPLPHDCIVWQERQIISYYEYKLQFNNLSPAHYKCWNKNNYILF